MPGPAFDPTVQVTLPPGEGADLHDLSGLSELLAVGAPHCDPRFDPSPLSESRFTLDKLLATGGMGAVYRGRDTRMDRAVAVKVLRDEHCGRADTVSRFADEAQITGRLQHPGIVPVHDFGLLADGRPFLAMQYVPGRTLAAVLADRTGAAGELPHLLKIFEKVCDAVAYAHDRGVLHRDLKPTNVLVGDFGVVKVIDWGLAKLVGVADADACTDGSWAGPTDGRTWPHTLNGSVMGTPAYMSPEQAAGRTSRLDERCDVFALGAILCEILTGGPPYPPGGKSDILAAARQAELTDAFQRLEGCRADGELIALAKRCLAAEPLDRPRNAGEVAAVLTAYLEVTLRRAERDLVRFFEMSPDLFCIAGFDGYFRRVNENFTRVLGYPAAELISRPYLDFVHPDDRTVTRAEIDRVAHGLPVARFRNRYRNARGQYRWFDWTSRSFEDEGLVYAVARDVTDYLDTPDRG